MTAEHFLLVEQVERHEAEQARIARVLGATDCCTFGCNQGRNCPVRAFPVTTGHSMKAPPRPIYPPPPPPDTKDHVLHLLQWLALSAVFVLTMASSAGFFYR